MTSPDDRIFSDEDIARQYIETMRWPAGPCCTRCGSQRVIRMGGRTQSGMLLCRECRNKFTCRIGTAMERSHVPLHKWLRALLIVTTGDRHLSAQKLKLALDLGSYRTAWLMTQRLREALSRYRRAPASRPPRDGLGLGAAEVGQRPAAIKELSFDEAALAILSFAHAETRRKTKPKAASDDRELNWELNPQLEVRRLSVPRQPNVMITERGAPEPAQVGDALGGRGPTRGRGAGDVESDVLPSLVPYGVGGPGSGRSSGGLVQSMNATRERSS